jgi:hypothetical protein
MWVKGLFGSIPHLTIFVQSSVYRLEILKQKLKFIKLSRSVIYTLLIIFSFLSQFSLFAQSNPSFTLTYNHQTLLVKDLEISSTFYKDVIEFN